MATINSNYLPIIAYEPPPLGAKGEGVKTWIILSPLHEE